MSAVLETQGLTKTFGALTAAAGITARFEEGSVAGLIGGNGAGKTTFLNLVTGYLKPTAGAVRFDGREVTVPTAGPTRRRSPVHSRGATERSGRSSAGPPAPLSTTRTASSTRIQCPCIA